MSKGIEINPDGKICTNPNCPFLGNIQSWDSFSKNKKSKDGHKARCKTCLNAERREYGKNNKEKIKTHNEKIRKEKPEKFKEYKKTYVKKHTEEIKKYSKKWKLEHPEKVEENKKRFKENRPDYYKQYHIKNRKARLEDSKKRNRSEKYRKMHRERQKEKRNNDLNFAISCRMSSAIGNALKEKKAGRHWEDIVGYTVTELIKHLEKLFYCHLETGEKMTWENRGKSRPGLEGWEIDHIRPKSSFTYSSPEDAQFKECWALKNLRPLWSSENRSKKDKSVEEFEKWKALQ